MTLDFYKYTGAENVINKRTALQTATTVSISSEKIEGVQDIENPTLYVRAEENVISGYNYVYIREWQRYYFVQRSQWVGDGIYLISLREDYLNSWSVKAGAAGYGGVAKYSGLGSGNLKDPRCVFKPVSKIEKFDIDIPQGDGAVKEWYVLKFYSDNPFWGSDTSGFNLNIAYMNPQTFRYFVSQYNSKTEAERVMIASCIRSVNKVSYTDPTAVTNQLGIKFRTPFNSDGGISYVEISLVSAPNRECYLYVDPSDLFYLSPTRFFVSTGGGSGVMKNFNPSEQFWTLDAKYLLKFSELQPIPFDPRVFGLENNFNIMLKINYEPYTENYVITFCYLSSGFWSDFTQTPLLQQCKTSVPFITDTSLDMFEQQTLNNTLGLVGGIMGGFGSAVGGVIQGNPLSVIGGVTSMIAAGNQYDMKEQQLLVSQFTGYGMSGIIGGSADWIKPIWMDFGCYVITQEPYSTLWANLGKPDGRLRSFMALAGTGYAELELVNPPALAGASYNELNQFASLCRQGVIF